MIPASVRRGDYGFTSSLADFEQLAPALTKIGMTIDDVVQVGIAIGDPDQRAVINPQWRDVFGSPESWPALRITRMTMPPGVPMQLYATAVAGGGRKAIVAAGFGGARAGDLFVTSSVSGKRMDGTLPEALGDEIKGALDNVCALVKEAGGTPDDLLHFWAFAVDGVVATDFTPSWLERFPVDGDRPARKTFLRATLDGPERLTFQATARIGGGKRTNHEVPWVQHKDPLPMGARIGNLFMSSGVLSNPPDANAPKGLGALAPTAGGQLDDTFTNLEQLLDAQGAKLGDVAMLGVVLANYADLPALETAIAARFPAAALPAVQIWSMPFAAPDQKVQLFATAVTSS